VSVPTSKDLARSDALDSKKATLKAAEAVLEAAMESSDESLRTPRRLQRRHDAVIEARAEVEAHYARFPEDRT
jgi:hypothetical protein